MCLTPACSAGHPAPGRELKVTERDFRLTLPATVAPGDLLLSAHNRGPDAHELIIIRATGDELPLRSDGITVDEDAVAGRTVAAIEPYQPGTTEEVRIHLDPGRYWFICNMSGHYLGGMDADLVVR
jgi:uncharacterized cupredoxin-like copper-binding protein